MAKIWIMVLLFIVSVKSSSFGEGFWAVDWQDGATQQERHHEKISHDEEYQFIIDNIPCHVTKATLNKLNNGSIIEVRDLWCLVANGKSISVSVGYDVRSKDCVKSGQLVIQENDKLFIPFLSVICK